MPILGYFDSVALTVVRFLISWWWLLSENLGIGNSTESSPSCLSQEAYITDTATQLKPHFDLLCYAGNNYLPHATSTHCKSCKSCKQSMYYHPTTVSLLSLFASAVNSLTYLSFSAAGHENIITGAWMLANPSCGWQHVPAIYRFFSSLYRSIPNESSTTTAFACSTCHCLLTLKICQSNKNGNAGWSFTACYKKHNNGTNCSFFKWANDRLFPPTSWFALTPPPLFSNSVSPSISAACHPPSSYPASASSNSQHYIQAKDMWQNLARNQCKSTWLHPECNAGCACQHCLEAGGCRAKGHGTSAMPSLTTDKGSSWQHRHLIPPSIHTPRHHLWTLWW